ncbi:MAG: hypothetical protein ACTSV3_01030 [Candidatus Thorarchaeota archaeon]|nr:MAG: hypothetical protein DRP09_04620 [Candidatus Thorarchaeota archaeon]
MKYLFLATDDNKMQLFHLLINAVNFYENDHEVAVVLECGAPRLLIGIADGSINLPIFNKALKSGLINHACKGCTSVFSATEAAKKLGVPLRGDLNGHSDLLPFVEEGYTIITF